MSAETAAPPIRSAAEIDYPPFSIVDEQGKASGFSVELLRAALSAMGRDVTFKTGPWAGVRGWLEKGEIDALPLAGRTPERESLFDFTFPYMTLHGAIVVRKTTSDIWHLGDLAGRTVAVMKGDNAEEFLRRKNRGIDIRTTATFEEALRELSAGHHDAVFIQRLVALRLIQESGITNVKVVNRPVEEFSQDFCFAVKEGDRDTLALLNEGLSIVMADGTYRHLHAKWFASMELPTHRRIVIGGDHNFPPFEYLDENGRPTGYNVDLTRAIAREVGLDIEIRLGPWAKIREALARGEVDAIQGMFYSHQRDLTFDFSPSHTVNHCVAVVRKEDGPPPARIEELMQKRIVVQEGDIMHDFALEKKFKKIFAAEAQEDALRELAQGKHDVALVSRLTALYWIKQYGWETLVVGKKPFVSHEYCYAVPKNKKSLLAQFSEGLNILEKTGEYRRIQEKWFGVYEDLPPTLAEVMRHVALIAGPLLLLLCGFFLWSWSLRKQVAARTEALRKSEEFQRAMVDCSPVAIYSVDFGGRVMAWNSSAERIFGWREEEVAGKPLPIVPEERRGEFDTIRKQIMAGQIFVGREVVRKKKDGTLFHGSLSAAPIRDAEGEMTGIIAAMEDISERKASEIRVQHLNNVLRAIREVNQLIVRERDPERLIEEGCRLLVENRGYPSALIVLTDAENRPVSWSMAGLAAASEELAALLENGN
ncbi:MAG: transporter substrate-binding domain-containing protein, partial [Desulfobacterales bacterium]|nr:transporter substrate-binding domain-containing protein [Desulfobacterales bacterium]